MVAGVVGSPGQRAELPLAQTGLPGGGCLTVLASCSSSSCSFLIFLLSWHWASQTGGGGFGLQLAVLHCGGGGGVSHFLHVSGGVGQFFPPP